MQILTKKNRNLLAEMVRTDFKLRYQGSVLGYVWSLLRPLLLFAVLYMVFTRFLRFGGDPLSLLFGIVLWNFFVESTSNSLGSIVGRSDLIRKIKLPRYMIVVATTISALINLALSMLIVLAFVVIFGEGIGWSVLLLPLLLLQLYVFSLAVSFFLSAAYVRFRDVSYIWEVVTQLLFFVTPIIYPLTLIPDVVYQKLLLLSPIAQIIQDARAVLTEPGAITVHNLVGAPGSLIPFVITLLVVLLGAWYFRKEAPDFAENI